LETKRKTWNLFLEANQSSGKDFIKKLEPQDGAAFPSGDTMAGSVTGAKKKLPPFC